MPLQQQDCIKSFIPQYCRQEKLQVPTIKIHQSLPYPTSLSSPQNEPCTGAGLAPNAYLLANAPTCASQAAKLMPWKQDPHMETHAKAF